MRTRPPPERDFVDVLQKFKLSFNLLARLRAHIHDPNAPELVHFLFTPLALIVDAAQDVADGRLPSRVVQPLLTRDALNLLANCVTSKETELWHSLGDAWLVPRYNIAIFLLIVIIINLIIVLIKSIASTAKYRLIVPIPT